MYQQTSLGCLLALAARRASRTELQELNTWNGKPVKSYTGWLDSCAHHCMLHVQVLQVLSVGVIQALQPPAIRQSYSEQRHRWGQKRFVLTSLWYKFSTLHCSRSSQPCSWLFYSCGVFWIWEGGTVLCKLQFLFLGQKPGLAYTWLGAWLPGGYREGSAKGSFAAEGSPSEKCNTSGQLHSGLIPVRCGMNNAFPSSLSIGGWSLFLLLLTSLLHETQGIVSKQKRSTAQAIACECFAVQSAL